MGMGMMGFGLLMMLFVLLIVAGVIALTVLAVIYLTGSGRFGEDESHARHILDERYAKGEIGDEEYQRRQRELGSSRSGAAP